jgi:hypothetical protein
MKMFYFMSFGVIMSKWLDKSIWQFSKLLLFPKARKRCRNWFSLNFQSQENYYWNQKIFCKVLCFILLIEYSCGNKVFWKFEVLSFWDYASGVVNQAIDANSEVVFNPSKIDHRKFWFDVNCVEFVTFGENNISAML